MDGVRGTARLVIVAEGPKKQIRKAPRDQGVKPSQPGCSKTSPSIIKVLFGRWPYLKKDAERSWRGGPALRWLRAVLGHVSPPPPSYGLVVADPSALPFSLADWHRVPVNCVDGPSQEQPLLLGRVTHHVDLKRSVAEMLLWTDETLGARFEKATAHAKRGKTDVPQG